MQVIYRKHAPGRPTRPSYEIPYRSIRCLRYSDHAPKAPALPLVTLPSFFFCDLAVLPATNSPEGILHDRNISGLPCPVMAPDRRFGFRANHNPHHKVDDPGRVAKAIERPALPSSPSGVFGVLAHGTHATDLSKLIATPAALRAGPLKGFNEGGAVAIGKGLAERLSLGVGDGIALTAPANAVTRRAVRHVQKPTRSLQCSRLVSLATMTPSC
jgi:hypothetical protein